jgi:cytochrome c553
MRIVIFFLMTFRIMAQDGAQLYGLYCSACHAADGKGATGGQFPPLAGSEWVAGTADRSIKIVLQGLHQPIEVSGKTYNLEMPPQGAALTDEHIAAILTYVRSAWGNKDSAVSVDQVKKVRAATLNRKEYWTAPELLKLHPLENVKPPLANLISHHYKGQFDKLPDLTKLKPDAVEEEPSGFIDYSDYAKTDHFAMMWEGELETAAGKHEFHLDSDDMSRLIVDGNVVLEIKTPGPIGRAVKKTIQLTKGVHKIRVEYCEVANLEGLSVGVKMPGQRSIKWLSREKGSASGKAWPEIILAPVAGRPVIYRNFIQGSTARGIGVGFPGEMNIAYSADNFAPEMIWSGKFIDAGHHWTDRGIGYEPPAGDGIVNLTKQKVFAFVSEENGAWPATSSAPTRFRGYQLSPQGNPTFLVEVAGAKIFDAYESVSSPSQALQRSIRIDGNVTQPISLLVFSGAFQDAKPDRFSAGGLTVQISGGAFRYGKNTVVLDLKGEGAKILYSW